MTTHLSLILTAPPSQAQAARAFGLPVAHMAYRVGPGPRLLRSSVPVSLRGGLLMLDDRGYQPGHNDPAPFCQELKRECLSRGYDGIIANWESLPSPESVRLARAIGDLASAQGWPFYVTEQLGSHIPQAKTMISSALSGGSLRERLREATERFGQGRPALAVELCPTDFPLPSVNGQGKELTGPELRHLMATHRPAVFFSEELCARYFTYRTHEGETHFVLFDDADTVRKKLRVARESSVQHVLMAYPQVAGLLPAILKKG